MTVFYDIPTDPQQLVREVVRQRLKNTMTKILAKIRNLMVLMKKRTYCNKFLSLIFRFKGSLVLYMWKTTGKQISMYLEFGGLCYENLLKDQLQKRKYERQ